MSASYAHAVGLREVRLGLLEVLLTGPALGVVVRDVRTHGQLGQRYRADH